MKKAKKLKQSVEKAYGPDFDNLKKNRVDLTNAEREKIMRSHAYWHHGRKGRATPAIFKAMIGGCPYYVPHTHRAYRCLRTLDGAINQFHKYIKQTA